MTPSLSTQIFRALSALPLLAVALVAAAGAGLPPVDERADAGAEGIVIEIVVPAGSATGHATHARAHGVATTLPGDAIVLAGDALAAGPRLQCAEGVPPPGARGLARMPGDITTVADRLRCAQ